MARGRMLVREISSSEPLAWAVQKLNRVVSPDSQMPLGEFARIIYDSILPITDDYGRLTGKSFEIKASALPTFDYRSCQDIEWCLAVLDWVGVITWYVAADGKKYIQVNDFEETQKGLKRTKPKTPHYQKTFERVSMSFLKLDSLTHIYSEAVSKFTDESVRFCIIQESTEESSILQNNSEESGNGQNDSKKSPPIELKELKRIEVKEKVLRPSTTTIKPDPKKSAADIADIGSEVKQFFAILQSCPKYPFETQADYKLYKHIKEKGYIPRSVAENYIQWLGETDRKVKNYRTSLTNSLTWEKNQVKQSPTKTTKSNNRCVFCGSSDHNVKTAADCPNSK